MYSKICSKCAGQNLRKVIRPTKDELEKMVNEIPVIEIGKLYGVSDNAIRKWCKDFNIELNKGRGFWSKRKSGAGSRDRTCIDSNYSATL